MHDGKVKATVFVMLQWFLPCFRCWNAWHRSAVYSPRLCSVFLFSPRAPGPAGSAGVGSLHVRQGPAAAALDGHGQHIAGASQTVAPTGQGHLTPVSHKALNNKIYIIICKCSSNTCGKTLFWEGRNIRYTATDGHHLFI